MNETVVVPDSIEPYIGFKALNIRQGHSGVRLESPSQKMLWPTQQKAVATHPGNITEWGWQLVPEGTTPVIPHPYAGYVPFNHPHEVAIENLDNVIFTNGQYYVLHTPPDSPPEGMMWVWRESSHQVGAQICSCGIYVVSDLEEALPYFHEDLAVLVSVALWGTVTKATRGARGEFAYPQEIVAWSCPMFLAEQVAEQYGIPIDANDAFKQQVGSFGRPKFPGSSVARVAARAPEVRASVSFPPTEQHSTRPIRRSHPGPFMGARLVVFALLSGVLSMVAGMMFGPLGSVAVCLAMLGGWTSYTKRLYK